MDFTDFRDNTVAFMAENVVIPPSSGLPAAVLMNKTKGMQESGRFTFRLRKTASTAKREKDGHVGGVWQVEKPDKWNTDLPEFKAWFCAYNDDDFHLVVLTKGANLMLTPAMNGCSFGVGSPASDGARVVGHVNISRPTNTAEGLSIQAAKQKEHIEQAFGKGSEMIGPLEYTPFGSGQTGTTFGVRNAGDGVWSFYTQIWRKDTSSSYTLKEVKKFA